LKLRKTFGVSVIAIKRKIPYAKPDGTTDFKDEIIIGPGADDEITVGDVLVVLGHYESLEKIEKV
jgi:K+/H+ antiporter YhaU regulatory subunit KhtT